MYIIISPDDEYGYPVLAAEVVFTSKKRAENYIKKSGILDSKGYYEIIKYKSY